MLKASEAEKAVKKYVDIAQLRYPHDTIDVMHTLHTSGRLTVSDLAALVTEVENLRFELARRDGTHRSFSGEEVGYAYAEQPVL